jgi:hypothetical protein
VKAVQYIQVVMPRQSGASTTPWRWFVRSAGRSGILNRPVKPGDDELGKFANAGRHLESQ